MLVQLLYIVALFAALASGFTLLPAFTARDALDRAALAALACGLCVVPYVFARAVQIVVDRKEALERHRDLVRALDILGERIAVASRRER